MAPECRPWLYTGHQHLHSNLCTQAWRLDWTAFYNSCREREDMVIWVFKEFSGEVKGVSGIKGIC